MPITSVSNVNGGGQTLGHESSRVQEAREHIGNVTLKKRFDLLFPTPPIPAPRPSHSLPPASNQPEYLETLYQSNNLWSSTANQESLVEGMLSSCVINVNEPAIEKPVSTSTAADQNSKNIQHAASFDAVSIPIPSENTADKNQSKVNNQQKGFVEYFADLMVGCRPRCFGGRKQSKKLEAARVVGIEMQATKNGVENK